MPGTTRRGPRRPGPRSPAVPIAMPGPRAGVRSVRPWAWAGRRESSRWTSVGDPVDCVAGTSRLTSSYVEAVPPAERQIGSAARVVSSPGRLALRGPADDGGRGGRSRSA